MIIFIFIYRIDILKLLEKSTQGLFVGLNVFTVFYFNHIFVRITTFFYCGCNVTDYGDIVIMITMIIIIILIIIIIMMMMMAVMIMMIMMMLMIMTTMMTVMMKNRDSDDDDDNFDES